jgi:DNA-binding transcriptional LysR family regulator
MTTQNLYEFLVLSKTLNYSQAASTLYISQSTLTKHIKAMEKELETELFSRTTHGVTLTPSGFLLSKKAANLIDRCNAAYNDASDLARLKNLSTSGTVHVGCVLEFSYASHIQIFTARFLERYPDIQVNFHIYTEETSEQLVTDSPYDILITPCDFTNLPVGTMKRFVQSHHAFAALPPGHPLISRSSIRLRDLRGETIIVPFSHQPFGSSAKNWVQIQKATLGQVTCKNAPNFPTALFDVLTGKGIAIVPKYIKDYAGNNIFFVDISTESCRFNEYLYYNHSNENDSAHLFYEEFCRQLLNVNIES